MAPVPQRLRGTTQVVGAMGWPISHSRSPAMHNAAFAACGLDWVYLPFPVTSARLGEAVGGIRALGLRGINVTIPHKQAVMPWLDDITPAAKAIQAVNTIIVGENGRLLGDNTDAIGFLAGLQEAGFEPAGKRVLLLGAGGSARAVSYALGQAGARQVIIMNRSLDKAIELGTSFGRIFPRTQFTILPISKTLVGYLDEIALVVNCTSLGMMPHADSTPWPEKMDFPGQATLYDLVYNPSETRLMADARAAGVHVIGGLGMLIHQGAAAFERWTGQPAPLDVMRQALEER